jgi:anti-sigma regulatory factor (Ser/Thr protein kinase)
MLHGQQRTPVRIWDRRDDQEPLPIGLPEQLLPGALLHGALRPGALLPVARWSCRQIGSSPRDAGLACRRAREFTGHTLQGWGLPMLAEDAAVIASELVTNALLHGCARGAAADQVELLLWRRAGQMVCAVTDPGPQPPVLVSPGPLAETGRGLQVVQALSVTWGWTRLGGRRKVVWAALRLPGLDAGSAIV